MARHISAETLKAAEEYARKRELVHVETSEGSVSLYVGSVCVRSWSDTLRHKKYADTLAVAIRAEVEKRIEQHAAAVAREGRIREVCHY